MSEIKNGYQPIKKTNTEEIIPPNCGSHVYSDYKAKYEELKEKLELAERARDYWKESSYDWRHKCTSKKPFKAAVKAQTQLKKAKKIIRELLDYGMYRLEVKERAEQFLEEE